METHEESIYNFVKVVKADGRLRVVAYDGRFVRFPKKLRIMGAEYEVGKLKEGKGYWIACEPIIRIN